VPTLLNDMPLERAGRLFLHPIHQDAFPALVQFIVDLRQRRTYPDYYRFQQELLDKVLEVQGHRAACRRVARRLRTRRTIPSDAPELRSGEDVNNPESWELEADVCERVDRQFRSIADAMAWRVFNYDRRVIVAFSRNDPPGPMVGKAGLPAERDFVTQWSNDESSFVLLHDLTTCLRIGDATLFKSVGKEYEAYLYEIKKDPDRRKTKQLQRNRLAEKAIRDGGPLPGDPTARFVPVSIPYRTNLSMLKDAFDLAADRGVVGMKVPGGRALLAADMRQGYGLWSEQEFLERTGDAQERAVRRAGILNVGHHVSYGSDDRVARSPIQPPWAIYPLASVICANLIVDMGVYIVTVSNEPLLEALRSAGIRAQWVLPEGLETLEQGQIILRAYKGTRGIEMRPSDMQRLLLELVELPTWVATVDELLTRADSAHPWPYYSDESKVWA
jgi:hypothetical protein